MSFTIGNLDIHAAVWCAIYCGAVVCFTLLECRAQLVPLTVLKSRQTQVCFRNAAIVKGHALLHTNVAPMKPCEGATTCQQGRI